MRFVATADWQLGMAARFLPEEARARFTQARWDAVRRIGEIAAACDAAFVVVAGDVFESNQLQRGIIARTFEALRSYPVPVVLLPGNHDPLSSASIYDDGSFTAHRPEQVHVLRDSTPLRLADGLEVVGAPWHSKEPDTDLVAATLAGLEPVAADALRVLVGHGAVSTLDPDRESRATIDVPTVERALDEGVVQVAVLGDKHSTTEVAPGIWYPGTPEVTDRREPDPGHVLVITVDADGDADTDADAGTVRTVGGRRIHVSSERVGTWSFRTEAAGLDSAADVDALLTRLRALPAKERTAVWLTLSGTLSTSNYAHLEAELAAVGELFAHLDHWRRHTDLAVLPDDHDFSDMGLTGFAADAVVELVDRARSDAPGAARAQDALALLFRLTGGARR